MSATNLKVINGEKDHDERPMHDLPLEECVLGSMILENGARAVAVNMLAPEDFYREQHRIIFQVLVSMQANGKPVDHHLLAAELDSRGLLDTVGDREYLLLLADTTPNPHCIKEYARIVKDLSDRRSYHKIGHELQIGAERGDYYHVLARLQSLETASSPSRYFDGAFVPKRLGDEICRKYDLRYASGQLYAYQDGVFRPEGEDLVRQAAQELLGEKSNETRKREAAEYVKTSVTVDIPAPDLQYINTRNGRLHWRTGELVAHSPEFFDVIQVPVEYDRGASCPEFGRFLETTLDAEVIPLVEEIMGYCLIPDTRFEKAFVFTGSGSNGKSVLLHVLTALLGRENVAGISLQSLEENRFAAAALVGKLANVHPDLDSRALKSSTMFKALVSGDRLNIEEKFCKSFEYTNYARFVFSANSVPLTADKSFAFLRRPLIIRFERSFTGQQADKNLREKLTTPEELSGILNRSLAGLNRLYRNDDFTIPAQVEAALEEYHRANDSIKAFVSECCEITPEGRITKADFRDAYRQWCSEQGLAPMGDRKARESLLIAVPGLGERREGNRGKNCWIGILSLEQGCSKDDEQG
jgi:putative DNA primase/helicase